MKKHVRVKVRYRICIKSYDIGIFKGRKILMQNVTKSWFWLTEKAAIRNAKAMAKIIGVKYDPEIVKQHGC